MFSQIRMSIQITLAGNAFFSAMLKKIQHLFRVSGGDEGIRTLDTELTV